VIPGIVDRSVNTPGIKLFDLLGIIKEHREKASLMFHAERVANLNCVGFTPLSTVLGNNLQVGVVDNR
jgi:hypothetical protein